MNILAKIEFPSGTEYLAKASTSYDSKQWVDRIVSVGKYSYGVGEDFAYEVSNIDLVLDDQTGRYRAFLINLDDRAWMQVTVTLYREISGTWTQFRVTEIYDWIVQPDQVKIRCTEKATLKDLAYSPYIINEETYPGMPVSSKGQVGSSVFGWWDTVLGSPTATENTYEMIKAWRVDKSGTSIYLIGDVYPAPQLTFGAGSSSVFKPDGTDVSNISTIELNADGLYYIDSTADAEDFLTVKVYPAAGGPYTFLDMMEDILDVIGVTYDITDISDMFALDEERNFVSLPFRYELSKKVDAEEVLKEFCKTAEIEYYIDTAKKVHFKAVKYDALTVNKTFQTNEIISFSEVEFENDKIENKFFIKDAYDPIAKIYRVEDSYNADDSQARLGVVFKKELSFPMTHYSQPYRNHGSFTACKFRKLRTAYSRIKVQIELSLTNAMARTLLDLISFPHPDALSAGSRLYQIRQIEPDLDGTTATLTLYDVNDWTNLYTGFRFLMQSNIEISDSWRFLDYSLTNSADIVRQASSTIRHNTGQKKFGSSSFRFPGTADDVLTILPDSDVVDPTLMPNWVLSAQIRFDVAATVMGIFSAYKDDDNRFFVALKADDTIQFVYRVGGVNQIVFVSNAVLTTADTWYQIVLAKIGSDWGWYINGAQEGYLSDGTDYGIAGIFQWGQRNQAGGISDPFDGWMDEYGIMVNNTIGWGLVDGDGKLAPVVGETDSHTPQAKAFNIYGLQ